MKLEEVLSMPAGDEMDDLIAELVMGWHKGVSEFGSSWWLDAENRYQHIIKSNKYYEDEEDFHLLHFHPSESVLWAWEVIGKIDRMWSITYLPDEKTWEVTFIDEAPLISFYANDAPLAICRRALLWAMEKK